MFTFRKSTRIHSHGVSDAVACSSLILVVCLCLFCFAQPARADIVWSGDIDPADPNNWNSDTDGYIGKTHNGSMEVNNGSGLCSAKGHIGRYHGSEGTVTIDGDGSTWACYGYLTVGFLGTGTLSITNGGAVSNSWCNISSSSEVTVNGADSIWTNSGSLSVGDSGSGTLSITNGATVSSTDGVIGYEGGSTGEVTVDGAGSNWTNSGYLSIGPIGTGTLSIINGGAVSCTSCNISSSSEVTVNGADSIWTNSGSLSVGDSGSGTLSITNGATVSSTDGVIGYEGGSTGEVTVDGAGSNWTNSGYLSIGPIGTGTLSIINGGAVSCTSCYIDSSSEVTVNGAGSIWTNSGSLSVGDYGSGTLNITDGGVVSNDDGDIGYWSNSTGEVTVDGAGSTWTNSDDLYVGDWGSGTLNITGGGLVSVAGDLTIDYDEDGDGFINMATGGMLALSGDADDSLFDFLGLIDGTDAIRYWDNSISDWADITGATYGDDYTLSYLTEGDLDGYTMLTVEGAITGDANRDGVVNDQDASILAAHWQQSGMDWEDGDFNGDGIVNDQDASILAANWQQTWEGAAAVPEPAAIVLCIPLCLAGLLLGRRRYRSLAAGGFEQQ